jgi:hypothetical protein
MALESRFDPEADRLSATGCLNDSVLAGKLSYALTVGTASASIGPIPPGIYLVFLDGLDPLRTVVLKTGAATVAAERPTNGRAGGRGSAVMPGSLIERIRVSADEPYVAASVSQGTGTLYLVPLVTT